MLSDGFVQIGHAGGKPRKGKYHKFSNVQQQNCLAKSYHSLSLAETIAEMKIFVAETSFFNFLMDALRKLVNSSSPIVQIICFGLGSMNSSETSQYQFALLLLIQNELGILSEKVGLFDPVFTEEDMNLIKSYGFQCIMVNTIGKYVANERTLFYMPHCTEGLYSNLLRENWQEHLLKNVVILGNSFDSYIKRDILQTPSMVKLAVLIFREILVSFNLIHELQLCFNDMSVHYMDVNTIVGDIWNHDVPEIRDCEIILGSK